MDVNPLDTIEQLQDEAAAHKSSMRLNTLVAITVALLATFLGICKVKDDNIVQSMQQAQADKLDHWAFFQARNIRQEVAEATVSELKLAAVSAPPSSVVLYQAAIQQYETLARDQATKKAELKAMAEQDQRNYDSANFHDDQFDLSDALLALSISLLAVTALTQQTWLYWISLLPTVFGVAMGLAGLFAWKLHPDVLIRLLS